MKRGFILLFVAMVTMFEVAANGEGVATIEIMRGEAVVQDSVRSIATIEHASGKYMITIGGNINMKASYDFDGAIDNPDFITSLIPVPGSYDTRRRFYMDATTSRIEIKGLARDTPIGDVELCLNSDMRGGSAGSYMPRIRLAYVSFSGWLVGCAFTAFCDMGAAAPNIDFQGPSVCPYIYTTQVRYDGSLLDDKLTLGGAVEYHGYSSATLGGDYLLQSQYLPNVVGYVERNWHSSHIRLTGLYKSLPLYDSATERDVNLDGWAAQLSGSVGVGSFVKVYYSATCGEGVTDYMQDTYGSGLDVVMSGDVASRPIMPFLYGWQAAALAQITDRVMVSAGYSQVSFGGDAALYAASDYRRGDYLFGNIFYSLTPRIQLATEYLWGARENVDASRNTANRINTMIQYSF
ncbi:MAG: DcaP family trimeric outer membrane transporter [Rikenellaceae bacterium]